MHSYTVKESDSHAKHGQSFKKKMSTDYFLLYLLKPVYAIILSIAYLGSEQ